MKNVDAITPAMIDTKVVVNCISCCDQSQQNLDRTKKKLMNE